MPNLYSETVSNSADFSMPLRCEDICPVCGCVVEYDARADERFCGCGDEPLDESYEV